MLGFINETSDKRVTLQDCEEAYAYNHENSLKALARVGMTFEPCYDGDMYIDLSVPINEKTPVYPGDPVTKIEQVGILSKDGYCGHHISMGLHVGTHIDAPMHMLEGGKSLDEMPLEQCIGRGRYIEVVNGDFGVVKRANIEEGDIVLFHTGMSDKYDSPTYFEDYPAMSEEVARYLAKIKVKMVGVDTCSIDNQESFPIHKILLGADILIIENLTNLRSIAGKECKIFALPLRLQIDGSPARVIAEVQ